MVDQRPVEDGHLLFTARDGIEVAVTALGGTEWDTIGTTVA